MQPHPRASVLACALTALAAHCILALPGTAQSLPTNAPMISTRGHIDWVGGGWAIFTPDGAEWDSRGQPSPAIPAIGTGPGGSAPWPASICIYVHGFQTPTLYGQQTTTQVANALRTAGYTGTTIGFAWDGDPGINNFDMARESANLNGKVLAKVMKKLKMMCPGIKINVVTHSLGARVILSALKCGGCCDTVQMIAPAVDNEVMEPGEEFGPPKGGTTGGGNKGPAGGSTNGVKIWYNDEDDVLGGTYPLEEGDSALGSAGAEHKKKLPKNVKQCSTTSKMKESADSDGNSPNPFEEDMDAEDDHSGYIWCKKVMECIAKKLK